MNIPSGSGTVDFTHFEVIRGASMEPEHDGKFVIAVDLTDPDNGVCFAWDSVSYALERCPPGYFRAKGKVVDNEGRGIPGVKIMVPGLVYYTGPDGEYDTGCRPYAPGLVIKARFENDVVQVIDSSSGEVLEKDHIVCSDGSVCTINFILDGAEYDVGNIMREIIDADYYLYHNWNFDRNMVKVYINAYDEGKLRGKDAAFVPSDDAIYFRFSATSGNGCDDIWHEYGHAVQFQLYGYDDFREVDGGIRPAPDTGLAEGWAGYFRSIGDPSGNNHETPIDGSLFTSTPFADVLVDIRDGGDTDFDNDPIDGTSINGKTGEKVIWEIMQNKPKNIWEFYQCFVNAYPEYQEELCEIYSSNDLPNPCNPTIHGRVLVRTIDGTQLAEGIPVYLYQNDIGDYVDFDVTDIDGCYRFDLDNNIDLTKDKFYVEAKWENDTVKIHDAHLFLGAEVIRKRWPENELLSGNKYEEIPPLKSSRWHDIIFDDEDAHKDYEHAKIVFSNVSVAANYVKENYRYIPKQVNIYIHEPDLRSKRPYTKDGAIHIIKEGPEYYDRSTIYHEYGHAIHFQHGAGSSYPGVMAEGWAIYFASLLPEDKNAGDALEGNNDYCNEGDDAVHNWGMIYARIFHDLHDGIGRTDDDYFEAEKIRIWQTIMDDKVKTIGEFYEKFSAGLSFEEKRSIRSIYATKRIKAPDYNAKFTNVEFPPTIIQGDVAKIKFNIENFANYDDVYNIVLILWRYDTSNGYTFSAYGLQEGTDSLTKEIHVNEEIESDFNWDVQFNSPGMYMLQLAMIPINWTLSGFCFDYHDYDNGWIHYKTLFPEIFFGNNGLVVTGKCPININILDPCGLRIDKKSNEILNATYYEFDIDCDGDLDDTIIIPYKKIGKYLIYVIPEPNAEPTDEYTIEVKSNVTTLTLAENAQIKDIPDQPYIIEVTETGEIIPLDSPDLAIEKTASLSGGALSTEVNFTINVTNTGGIPLNSLEVVDTLPEGMSYSFREPTGTQEGGNVTWNLGPLGPGNSTRINLTTHVTGEKLGVLTNRAEASGVPEVGENVSAWTTFDVLLGIQAAIDAASPGDTIVVPSGTYHENVNVNKQLTLRGEGSPVVDAGGFGSAITVSADGCTIEGFVAKNSGPRWMDGDAGIKLTSDNNNIEGNNASGNNEYGIYLGSSNGNRIKNNTVDGNNGIYLSSSNNNTIENNDASGNNGIVLDLSSDNAIRDNAFRGNIYAGIYLQSTCINNVISGNEATGVNSIVVHSSSNNLIAKNNATGNTLNGITLYSSNSNAITDNVAIGKSEGIWLESSSNNNVISGNEASGNEGIVVSSSNSNTIINNKVTGNNRGILIRGDSNKIENNTATSNDEGICLQSSSSNTIATNKVSENNGPGIILVSSSSNTIKNNTVCDNSGHGICLDSSNDNTITNNTISDNGCIGIFLSSSGSNIITRNLVDRNGQSIDLQFSSSNVLYLNNFFDNTHKAWSNLDNSWNSTNLITYDHKGQKFKSFLGNNWSDYEGCDCNDDGIGDMPYEKINGGSERDYHPICDKPCVMKLEVEKIANVSSAKVGEWIRYTIWVNNTGNVNLTGVITCDNLTQNCWDIGLLSPGDTYTNTTLYQVKESNLPGPIINLLSASGIDPLGFEVNNSCIEIVEILYNPMIKTNKTANLSFGASGTEVEFTTNITNTGNVNLYSVMVTDSLPLGLEYISDDQKARAIEGYNVTWDLGTLNKSESKPVKLLARIDGTEHGNLTNRANATGLTPVGEEVSSEDEAVVRAFNASLWMEMIANPKLAAHNSDVIFTINVTNTGKIELDPVVLIDDLPEGLTYVSAEPEPDGTGSIRWNNVGPGSLKPGETATIKLVARVEGDAKGPLTNRASATGCPPHGCNVSCYCSADVDLPGLKVDKAADKGEYERGEEITYTIVIQNLAEVPVYDVEVKDVFDRGVEFVSASPPPDDDGIWRSDMIPGNDSVEIRLVVRVPKQEFEFETEHAVSGEGFVNVADDYSTTLMPYVIINRVSVTSANTYGQFSDVESVTVLGDPGTELSSREHGSGTYDGEEQLTLRTENKSISMNKDVSAAYAPTTLGLYRNRSVAYSSRWTGDSSAKNRATGASLRESYRYATRIDRESKMFLDENGSIMEIEAEFEGMGHIGVLKTSKNQESASFEAREDYIGSFRVYEKVDEYGSGVESDKSASGTGFVATDKRVRDSQRTYESGTGSYESEEQIRTGTNYIAKDINVTHQPSSINLSGEEDLETDQSLKWNEGIWSRSKGISYIGEEFSGVDRLDKETVAMGLNEMETDADFSGRARFRSILDGLLDMDEEYHGDYSLQRNVLLHGIPRYDNPHLVVAKEGRIAPNSTLILYNITLENDGSKTLAPIYVKDLFPPLAKFVNSSLRPSELTQESANWTLTHLAIGDRLTIQLWLNVSDYSGDEIVNRVEASGGYDGEWITARNFTALEINLLTCCLYDTATVTKTGDFDPEEPNVVWYQIDIQNNENSTRVARVVDPLPQGMILLNASIEPSTYEEGVITWNLIEIEPMATESLVYRTQALWSGTFTNRAEVDIRSVDGSVERIHYGQSVVTVGELEDQMSTPGWQPPDWGFASICEEACDLMS